MKIAIARRIPLSPAGRHAKFGGFLVFLWLAFCLPGICSGAALQQASAEEAFAPVTLRAVIPDTPRASTRENRYWNAVGPGWLRALSLLAPRLPLAGTSPAVVFSPSFRLMLAAAASDMTLRASRTCTPIQPSTDPLLPGSDSPPAMCVLRPEAVTILVRPLSDARQRMEQLLSDSARAAAWRQLLQELERAVQVSGERNASPENMAVAARTIQILLQEVRPLLLDAADGWLARTQDIPRLEPLVARLPESPLLHLLLAEARLRAGLPQQCMEAASAALSLAPDMARARYIRALAHWRLQQLALAEEDLDTALRITATPEETAVDNRRRDILRARGALRMLRGNTAGMCEDLKAACVLGDCEGLSAVRGRGQCLPPEGTEADPLPVQPRLPAIEKEARRDVPLWPPVTPETAHAIGRIIPVRVAPVPDPFVFTPRP